MKICITQTRSKSGAVQENIQRHLQLLETIKSYKADLVIFPELSITGYEPQLAEALAVNYKDQIFDPFQVFSNKEDTIIGIGMPTKSDKGVEISMIIFQPHKTRTLYSKQILHEDELPYFVSGTRQPNLTVKDKKIALGICYETLRREHFMQAVKNEAAIYIASVAKPDRGLKKAYIHFSSIACEFNIPILMSNCVGFCDNFMSNGNSSVWSKNGVLIHQLNEHQAGFFIYNTKEKRVEVSAHYGSE